MQKVAQITISVPEAISVCLANNLTFAAYQLPNANDPVLVVQKTAGVQTIDNLTALKESKGFLVAPFLKNSCNSMFLIQPDYVFTKNLSQDEYNILQETKVDYLNGTVCNYPEEISKSLYLDKINELIDAIKENKFDKAVLSRVKIHEGNYMGKISELFSELCSSYPNAFIYTFKAGSHLWIGATPEPLAYVENGSFKTASVAGTRPYNPEFENLNSWNNKEREEQNYVTWYIRSILKDYQLNNYNQIGPYAKKAGNLLHLRTDFYFDTYRLKNKIGNLIESLHPTPAVCGMPKEITMKFISDIESHEREYYTGFLGPVGIEKSISLFVNLRCMKVFKDKLALFVGGGITIDSIPEDEWQETEIKAETLLSVIRNLP